MATMNLTGGKKPKPGSDVVKEAPSKKEDTSLDNLDTSTLTSDPTKGKSMKLAADMQKVTDYQNKLNSRGANVKVDGIWGDETIKASRADYEKNRKAPTKLSTSTTKSSPKKSMILPKGDKEFKSVEPSKVEDKGKPVDNSAATSYFKNKQSPSSINTKSTTNTKTDSNSLTSDDVYDQTEGVEAQDNGIKGKKTALGNVVYPNGRMKLPSGRMTDLFDSKLPRRKPSKIEEENKKNEEEIDKSRNLGPLGKKLLKLVSNKRDMTKGYKPLLDGGLTEGEKEYKKKMKLMYK